MPSDEQLRDQFIEILTYDSATHVLRAIVIAAALVAIMALSTLYLRSIVMPPRLPREYSEPIEVEADNFFQYSNSR